MSSEQQAIGIMQGAFFVPKADLMNWVNTLLDLQITRIQQLGTGAVYCQIVDAMFPGKVPMQRVNWNAKNEWEFINNYKILQQAFAKCRIQKYIDIEKLCKSKYQDNLQFIQWMKRYYDLFNKNSQYDAKGARKNAHVDFSFVQYRNPLKKKQFQKLDSDVRPRMRSRSPYDGVKSKINNNRSVTVGKYESKNKKVDVYLQKLCQIRNILKKSPVKGKNEDSITKIKEILEEIQEDLPPIQEEIPPEAKLETVPSQSMLDDVHRRSKQKQKGRQNKSQVFKPVKKSKK